MLRAVLAVAITAALLAVSLPTVDSARVDHAETLVAEELDRLETAAERLAAENDPTGPGQPAARRVLRLRLPAESWGSTGVDRLHLPGDGSTVTWQVAGGGTHHRRIADGHLVGQAGGLRLGGSGSQRIVLVFRERHGESVVVAARPDS
ncbi:hypothetical protein ACKVMT_15270 [Halobacteriales archaeon Cl-PHB]